MLRTRSTLMHLILQLFCIVLVILRCAEGLPTVVEKQDGELECHRVAGYSTEWFLKNTKEEYKHSLQNNALFYSAGMSQAAQRIANESGLITIWDVWPCYLYNHVKAHTNPLRCIHGNATEQRYFFGNMSRAFAMKAQNFSTVLHSCDNYGKPPSDGIWGMVEFPALQQGGVVDFLEKINENKTLSEIFWRRPRDFVLGLLDNVVGSSKVSHNAELKRRESNEKAEEPPPLPPGFHGSCMSPKQLDFFDDVPW